MDFENVSSSLSHQAQALLSLQRGIEMVIGKGRVPKVMVDRKYLRTVAEQLRSAAELADRASILLDAEVEIPAPVK